MVNFNIEETWVQLNNLMKASIYFDRRLEVLYYGSEFNKDDSRYHIATCDHLFLPEVSDKNVITFSKSVPWEKVTITDIRAVANGVRVVQLKFKNSSASIAGNREYPPWQWQRGLPCRNTII